MVGISGRRARTIFQVNRNPRDHVRRGTEQQMSRKNIKLSILYQAESTTMIPLVEKLHKLGLNTTLPPLLPDHSRSFSAVLSFVFELMLPYTETYNLTSPMLPIK